jgi:hypothetical protein
MMSKKRSVKLKPYCEERVVDEEVASRARRRHWCSGEKGNGRPGEEAALVAR